MKPIRLFGIPLLVATLCFRVLTHCSADDANPVPNSKPARVSAIIPFTLGNDGRIYVQGRINNQIDATFLVDTGNANNLLSSTIQEKAHLPSLTITGGDSAAGKPVTLDGEQVKAVNAGTITLGGVNLTNMGFVLQSPKELPESGLASKPVDGIIGSQTWERSAIMLDFVKKHIVIWYPSALTKSEIKASNLEVLYTVPISPSPANSDIWITHTQFYNASFAAEQDMVIDTGASVTTIPLEIAKQLNLEPNNRGTATIFHNKKVTVETAQVTKMQAGDFTLLSHTVIYPSSSLATYPVSIGMDIFRGYMVLIDFGRKVMYFGSVGTGVNIKVGK